MRNAVQRRNHKERAQPVQREKWGVLEKHKDYSLRAKDYNEKRKRLKILREKAAERNPDEFSYGMLSSTTDRHGRKIQDRGNPTLSQDAIELLKTQDAGYLKTMVQKTRRACQKMEEEFVLRKSGLVQVAGGRNVSRRGEHVVFVENGEQQQSLGSERDKKDLIPFPGAQQRHTSSGNKQAILQSSGQIPMDPRQTKRQEVEELLASKQERAFRKRRKRERENQQSRLSALRARGKDLHAVEQQLDLQRAKISNSVGGTNKAGVRWKVRERKK
ncbi:MAG: hypothetical protein Q9220_002618 [cf. Caloplaca sp. 1 TL-2023]